MTDQPTVSRFVVRKGTTRGKWMIWDRNARGPAKLAGVLTVGLSEQRARQVIKELRKAYGK
jgi:hypothetical protein